MPFPVDLSRYRTIALDPQAASLTPDEKAALGANIALVRDAIVFMTALSNRKGLGGHTGGAYDIVPEALLVEGFIAGGAAVHPVHFDDAGHRVALQYVLAVLHGALPPEALLRYREYAGGLPGHPEADLTPGIGFCSGRLGHLWSHVNGLALAYPERSFILYSSDGAQQEGNNAEAARFAAAHGCRVRVLVDDNDTTISGSPSEYMHNYDVGATLAGLGIPADSGPGEELDSLHDRLRRALAAPGPAALVNKRPIAPGIPLVEGTPQAHDAISLKAALAYFGERNPEATRLLESQQDTVTRRQHRGCGSSWGYNRKEFGVQAAAAIDTLPPAERKARVLVVDSDLGGSCGLDTLKARHPELFISGGIMERNNFSVAAGFGSRPGAQGIFGTFAAFQEMLLSEITMARLNGCNVLAHFSHSGVDDMSDNTCHFGTNNLFADSGFMEDDATRLFFPADPHQLRATVSAVFHKPGLRFIYTTRSPVPDILTADGSPRYTPERWTFSEADDLVREGGDGIVVSYGETLYRALDAVEALREEGVNLGLVNKHCCNRPDEAMLQRLAAAPFVAVCEGQNVATGLGSRLGSWLLSRGLSVPLHLFGTHRGGNCGMGEQMHHQGLDAEGILAALRGILAGSEKRANGR